MVYIEYNYIRDGQTVPLKNPKIHLNNKLGYMESVDVELLSQVYIDEFTFLDRATNQQKTGVKYSVKVRYNNQEMYAVLTRVLAERLKQYPMNSVVKITRGSTPEGKTDLTVQSLGNTGIQPATGIVLKASKNPSNGTSQPNPYVSMPQQNNPLNQALQRVTTIPNPPMQKNINLSSLTVNQTPAVDKVREVGRELLNPQYRQQVAILGNENNFPLWKSVILDQEKTKGIVLNDTDWYDLYKEWCVQFYNSK